MALDLATFDVMAYLWETMEKTPEGNIRYLADDIDALWQMGFVDAERVPLATWRSICEPFRRADGAFHLNRDAFLSLDPYRYAGEIHVPFDALLINEGRYTDEGLADLFRQSIRPSVNVDNATLNSFREALSDDCRESGGLILIGREAKLRIKKLVDGFPSPLRNLELMFDQMLTSHAATATAAEFHDAVAGDLARKAGREASSFTASPSLRSEVLAHQLKALTKAKLKGTAPSKEKGTELKKLKRSPKGIRG